MGTDCRLITNKKIFYLDRFYCFSKFIDSEIVYKKEEFIKLNLESIKDMIIHFETYNEYNDKDKIDNFIYWIERNLEAIDNSDEINMIVDEHSDRYFSKKLLDLDEEVKW